MGICACAAWCPEPLARHHQLGAFVCGEPALDEWLKKHARAANASESARVLVVTPEDDTAMVVGYYALAAAQVEPADATERARKGQASRRPVPAVLLARLADDHRHQGGGLGRSLLQDVLLRCVEAADAMHLMMLMKDVRAFVERHPSA